MKLSTKARKKLSPAAFVFPDEKRYPIHDESHARNALARASGKSEEAKVRAAVRAKYPGIGKESQIAFLDELEKISGAIDWVKARPAALAKGMGGVGTNVGNAVASFATPKASLKRGWEATWRPGGKALHPLFKGLMAYGAYNDIKQMRPAEDPMGRGRSRIHRGLAAAGSQAGGIMAAPFGLSGGMVGSMVGAKAGDLAGRAIDRVRGFRRGPQQPPHLPPAPVGQQG